MADVAERVLAEEDNVKRVLAQLPAAEQLRELSDLELAGTGALLHNAYNGIENILKQVIQSVGEDLPDGPTWHRDLVSTAERKKIVESATAQALAPLMAFRHFFSHGYALDLEPERIEPLVRDACRIFDKLREDVAKFLSLRANTPPEE